MKRSALTKVQSGAVITLFVVLTFLLGGCGSGGGSTSVSSLTSSATRSKQRGTLTLTIKWPIRSKSATKVIPVAANSILITLVGQANTPTQQTVTQVLTPPAGGGVAAYTIPMSGNTLELGTYLLTAAAYPSADGTTSAGSAQASASEYVTVAAGPNTAPALTMGATIASITLAGSATEIYTNGLLQLVPTALDASGDVILTTNPLTDATSVTYTVSSANATVSATGLVTAGANTGSFTVTVTYDEGVTSGTVPAGTNGTSGTVKTAALTITIVVPGLATASWPKFHGDAQNTGQAGALVTGNAASGTIVARYATGNMIVFSSPAVASNGTVYVGSYDDNFYALTRSGSTFTKAWSYTTGGIIESSPAISAGGLVYVGSYDGNVYAFAANPTNTSNVQPAWTYKTPGIVHGSPAIGTDGTVYVGGSTPDPSSGLSGSDNTLYALDGLTGQLKWSYSPGTAGGVQTAPALSKDGGTVYFGDLDGNVYAVSTRTHNLVWQYATGGECYASSPAVANVGGSATVFIGAINAGTGPDMFAINAVSGSLLWSTTIPGGVYATPAISTGANGNALEVYVGSYDSSVNANNALFQLSPSTGNQNWQFPASGAAAIGPIASSPVIGNNGAIYFGSDDANVYSALPTGVSQYGTTTTGAPVGVAVGITSNFEAVESSPGLGADGTVYIGCFNGQVVAIQ